MVCTIFLGKQGKGVYTIGPERRECAIEASDPEKEKKKGFHGGVVYCFHFCPWCAPYCRRALSEQASVRSPAEASPSPKLAVGLTECAALSAL